MPVQMGMNWRKHFLEALTLIVAAVLCAVVSNAMAGRERKLALGRVASEQRGSDQRSAISDQPAPAPVTATTVAPATTTTQPPVPTPAPATATHAPTPAPATA